MGQRGNRQNDVSPRTKFWVNKVVEIIKKIIAGATIVLAAILPVIILNSNNSSSSTPSLDSSSLSTSSLSSSSSSTPSSSNASSNTSSSSSSPSSTSSSNSSSSSISSSSSSSSSLSSTISSTLDSENHSNPEESPLKFPRTFKYYDDSEVTLFNASSGTAYLYKDFLEKHYIGKIEGEYETYSWSIDLYASEEIFTFKIIPLQNDFFDIEFKSTKFIIDQNKIKSFMSVKMLETGDLEIIFNFRNNSIDLSSTYLIEAKYSQIKINQ